MWCGCTVVAGVLDGHSGGEVAEYAARRLQELLLAHPCWQRGGVGEEEACGDTEEAAALGHEHEQEPALDSEEARVHAALAAAFAQVPPTQSFDYVHPSFTLPCSVCVHAIGLARRR
jgi:hypothetical protein